MTRTKAETARDFKAIVDEDYAAYKAEPLNLRLAFHLALGLFLLKDWTYWQYSNDPRWPLKKKKAYQKMQHSLQSMRRLVPRRGLGAPTEADHEEAPARGEPG